ncbi:MAG: hypothetical protein JRC90_09900 [Deltaproteobacteria bacterium]|nr:hypothetical protein [Deltaproteobacteria bacterium]
MTFNRGSGFNRSKFNSDTYSNVLYSGGSAKTQTKGVGIAESIFYASGIAKTFTSTLIDETLLKSILMEYSADLAVGARVCINANDFTVKLDGINAIDKFTGEFPYIFPVTCDVIYEDGIGARTVKIIVVRKDRHI